MTAFENPAESAVVWRTRTITVTFMETRLAAASIHLRLIFTHGKGVDREVFWVTMIKWVMTRKAMTLNYRKGL